jgi:Rrf2 family transcriptional regulator, iron-sulfur cluster assembly transcription factor
MIFSKTTEYAIRATIYLAQMSKRGKRVSLKEVSKEIESPEAFTAKILRELSKRELIKSIKGPNGGFEITDDGRNLCLADVLNAIEGDLIFRNCGLGLKSCSDVFPCPVHDQFKEVRDRLKTMMETTLIFDLVDNLEKGKTFLKNDIKGNN